MTGYIADHIAGSPDRPFFAYLAFGACHWPQQVPRDYVERARGRYDAGWTALRDVRFARQKAMGVVPADTALSPENPDVPRWESLSDGDRRFAVRCQEVYAAFLEHADTQLGRLLAALTDLGVRDDTIIVLLSDNGATAEGSMVGMADVRRELYIGAEQPEERTAAIDLLGGEETFPAYPLGWAAASNTPLRWYKSNTHEGGIRTPLIVNWPAASLPGGSIRPQFHHVSDVAPTLFELAGLTPETFEGTSFAYALRDGTKPTRKVAQIFESTGSRALWRSGWKAVARHSMGDDPERDRWELYNLDTDFAETHDLAMREPEHLAAMQSMWTALALKGNVLPLDDRRLPKYKANLPERGSRTLLTLGGSRLDRLTMPDVQRAHRITAYLDRRNAADGVILAAGNLLRGYELYVKDGRFHYVYLFSRAKRHAVSVGELPVGDCRLGVELDDGVSGMRTATLMINGAVRATLRIDRSWPTYALGAGLRCGENRGSPISRDYAGTFRFTGALRRVVIEVLS